MEFIFIFLLNFVAYDGSALSSARVLDWSPAILDWVTLPSNYSSLKIGDYNLNEIGNKFSGATCFHKYFAHKEFSGSRRL